MTIEWIPAGIENLSERYINNREADVTCDKCGVLGDGTLSVIQARTTAITHDQEDNSHHIQVIEVTCFV